MRGEQPLVSIIVPVYNREKYIARCIESIIAQTYKKIELILVDDGSADSSGMICQKYALRDNRIEYISKDNEGSGFARNTGIDRAEGDFIFFVDSDDFIREDCLEIMLGIALQYGADIVKCGYQKGNSNYFIKTKTRQSVLEKNHIDAFRSRDTEISVWGKLYAKKIFSNIRFPKETLFDDEFFTYKCIYSAERIVLLSHKLYYNYMSERSIMREKKKKMPLNIITKAYKERIEYFEGHNEKELVAISHKELAIRIMLLYSMANQYEDEFKNKVKAYQDFKYHYQRGGKTAAGVKEKLSLALFYRMPDIMAKIIRTLKR